MNAPNPQGALRPQQVELRVRLSREQLQAVHNLSRALGVSIQTVMEAALQDLLAESEGLITNPLPDPSLES